MKLFWFKHELSGAMLFANVHVRTRLIEHRMLFLVVSVNLAMGVTITSGIYSVCS